VIGGGPAGSLFAYYVLDLADTIGLELEIDLYDPQDFVRSHPTACNMCGGIISETLVQNLATDGINLPPTVVQRGIESYVLHMDGSEVRIETPVQEKRIASVYRGTGPRKLDVEHKTWRSFDGHLQQLAIERGAKPIRDRVTEAHWSDGYPHLNVKGGAPVSYDLVAVATGVNSTSLKLFEDSPLEYKPPTTTKTFIREYFLGEDVVEQYLGDAMHVFLLNLPGIEFAAIIPKLNCATVCLLGDSIDKATFQLFLDCPEVSACLPADWELGEFACHCSPRMNIGGAVRPYGDRIVFVGDSGVSRLYKDGIGAAYRTAKAAARTTVFSGVSEENFRRHYLPTCRRIRRDNLFGRVLFGVTDHIQNLRIARQAVLRNVVREQTDRQRKPRMSSVLWDMFTGSATYREIFLRTLHPAFVWQLMAAILATLLKRPLAQTATASRISIATVARAGGDDG
jgi:flavin-dependent dehydrogenase